MFIPVLCVKKLLTRANSVYLVTIQAEHVDLTLPPKSPIPGRVVGKGRQRTFSTSATISTEREPIIRASRRTIYTAGRPPWYDSLEIVVVTTHNPYPCQV